MTSTGTTVVRYSTKKKMRLGAHYDAQRALGAVTLDGDIEATTYLNLDELERLHARLGHVIDQMIEDKAIGFDAYSERVERGIDKIERDIQPAPAPKSRRKKLPPCDLTPEELRAQAIAEIEKIKEAKRRGDYR